MAQFLRPNSNITQTNFTGGFADIDEATADDTDYAFSANNTNATLEVGTTNPAATPDSAGTVTVRYRIARTNAGTLDGGGRDPTLTATVFQGGTSVASGGSQSTSGTWTGYSFTFAANLVTDWTNLRLRFTASSTAGPGAQHRGSAVSWAEIEAPDPAAVILTLGCSVGTFAVGSTAVNLLADRSLSGDVGSFALTGNSVSFTNIFSLNTNTGVFVVAGQAVDQVVQRLLSNSTGSFVLSGSDVDLDYTPVVVGLTLEAASGNFNVAGNNASVNIQRLLSVFSSTFFIGTAPVDLQQSLQIILLNVDPANFILTGQQNSAFKTSRLRTTLGDFNFTLIKLRGLRYLRPTSGTRGRVMQRTFRWVLGQYTTGNIERVL